MGGDGDRFKYEEKYDRTSDFVSDYINELIDYISDEELNFSLIHLNMLPRI